MHGIGGVCEGIATGLFASVKANPNVITKNALGGGIFYQWKFRAFKRANSYYYDLYDFFSFHKLYYFFKIISCFTDLRVKKEVEQKSLDVSLHGEKAYTLV